MALVRFPGLSSPTAHPRRPSLVSAATMQHNSRLLPHGSQESESSFEIPDSGGDSLLRTDGPGAERDCHTFWADPRNQREEEPGQCSIRTPLCCHPPPEAPMLAPCLSAWTSQPLALTRNGASDCRCNRPACRVTAPTGTWLSSRLSYRALRLPSRRTLLHRLLSWTSPGKARRLSSRGAVRGLSCSRPSGCLDFGRMSLPTRRQRTPLARQRFFRVLR